MQTPYHDWVDLESRDRDSRHFANHYGWRVRWPDPSPTWHTCIEGWMSKSPPEYLWNTFHGIWVDREHRQTHRKGFGIALDHKVHHILDLSLMYYFPRSGTTEKWMGFFNSLNLGSITGRTRRRWNKYYIDDGKSPSEQGGPGIRIPDRYPVSPGHRPRKKKSDPPTKSFWNMFLKVLTQISNKYILLNTTYSYTRCWP